MSFFGLLLRSLLLLALVLLGTVPSGMMRQAGPGGIRLVLCTGDGVKEVWLTEDGETVPVEDGKHERAGRKPHCVQVSLGTPDVRPPMVAERLLERRPVETVLPPHQVLHRQIVDGTRRTRAPPVFAV